MGALLLTIACAFCRITSGTVVEQDARMEQLLNASEQHGWTSHRTSCHWFIEQPCKLTPVHVHGGLGQ